jgi:DNA adenine methylase
MTQSIVKWAGGKTSLLPLIRNKLKLIDTSEATLYDIFGGGGSVSFAFVDSFKHVVLNDTNEELINLYNVVREKPNELMKELDAHQKKHSTDYYYTIRQMDRDSSYSTKTELYRAARMLYLNKTCYNGLYRVNTKGQFNVPIGRQKTVRLYNREQIMNIHEKLERITLENKDYNEVLESCKKGDLVYIDPPYDRINAQSFIEYNGQRFDSEDQKRLADKVDMLTNKGVYVIFSNSATENIKALYKKYLDDTSIIKARRNIAANGTSRKEIDEVLGDNFWGVNNASQSKEE